MVETRNTVELLGLNLRSFIIIAIVVGSVTGGNIWLNRDAPALGFERYSKFGFSFEYPQGMSIREQGLAWEGAPSEVSGVVQGDLMNRNPPEIIGVIWLSFPSAPDLEAVLDETFAQLGEGTEVEDREPLVMSEKDGYEMKYQFFTLIDYGTRLSSVVGIWYDTEARRVYVVFYISLPEAMSQQKLHKGFRRTLGSFENSYVAPQTVELEPYWPTAGWRTAKPEDLGMDAVKLDEMIKDIQERGIGVDSVTVIRDGYMVLDEYFPPFKEGERHTLYSCTKSVVSTLIGIALDEGYLEGLDQRMLDFFPDRTVKNLDPWKEAITLGHLLTMTAGFDARDSYLYNWEGLERMHASDDPLQYVLDLPMAEEPGTRFEYTNGVSHLLSCILTETTDISALKFAEEHLFGPLDITDVEWDSDTQGRNWGYSQLYLNPHDMAKIGYLFLNGGQWDGEQIVSLEWVDNSTAKHVDATIMEGYGYHWWISPNGYYSAVGYKGQFIHVVPILKLVVVFTSRSEEDFDAILSLLEAYIIPAVIQ